MPTAYEEIMGILSEIEVEEHIPGGTLKKIYDLENKHLHLRSRTQIEGDLQAIVSDAADSVV